MDQRNTRLTVKALWLQYYELKVEFAGKPFRVENAARGQVTDVQVDCLPEPEGFLVAT